jgi:hypothetical protein
MRYTRPVTDLIRERLSCRTYSAEEPLGSTTRHLLDSAARSITVGPRGTALRFRLVASSEAHGSELKGLGTYGFIRNPAAFIVGAATAGPACAEDYGWALECLVLAATDLGLGTCWLGGFFTRSSFAQAIGLARDERMPAVAAAGIVPDPRKARGAIIRRVVGAERRLPWERLFFDAGFQAPLGPGQAGQYEIPLEMVRIGPSASNRQPWRIVGQGRLWHFFVERTPGYPGGLAKTLLAGTDLQRVDIGIAMCHFELSARELDRDGRWIDQPPRLSEPSPRTEYVATWEDGRAG